MKQGTFVLIICGLLFALLPSVSAESDADFLGRGLADAEVGAVHPTDWVQQYMVLEVVPEEDDDEEHRGEYGDAERGFDDCEDDYGEGEYGECEYGFGGCGEDEGEGFCDGGDDDGQGGCDDPYYYVDFCNDAKLMGTGSSILAAAVILNFML